MGWQPDHGHSAVGPESEWDDGGPDLVGDVRAALLSDHPLDLLALVSSMLAAIDPRSGNPLDRPRDAPTLTRDTLVESFIEVSQPETSALLAVIAALSTNEAERGRIAQVLERRNHRLPAWLATIGEAQIYRTVEVSETLRDGDDLLLGMRFPSGHELTAVVYIDFNVGTLVKDAFLVPAPIADVAGLMQSEEAADLTANDIPLADVKARIIDAIATAAVTY